MLRNADRRLLLRALTKASVMSSLIIFSELTLAHDFTSNRARKGGYPSSIRKQVLGVKLAHREVAFTCPHYALDPFCEYSLGCLRELC